MLSSLQRALACSQRNVSLPSGCSREPGGAGTAAGLEVRRRGGSGPAGDVREQERPRGQGGRLKAEEGRGEAVIRCGGRGRG